ncbi:MAG TPA: response regulator transcription factor [Candidatus Nanopelagicaceae bacterium]|nr:response regulator transcription factor [Candidatus Nanopelagicaceae bacterium]
MSEAQEISFVILEDHPLLLAALGVQIRELYPTSQIAYQGKDVIAAAEFCSPNTVAIVDLDLGDNRKAADVVAIIVAKGARVLVVSALGEPSTIESVMIAGAHGYMTKRANGGEFKEAIEVVRLGGDWMSPEVAGAIASIKTGRVSLSNQERKALVLYASGLKLETVAHRMGLAPSTVKEYLDRVRAKYDAIGLDARTRMDLYHAARNEGLIP